MTEAAVPVANHTVLDYQQRELPVPLTDDEKIANSDLLARLLDDKSSLEADELQAKAEAKARREALDAELQSVAAVIRARAVNKSVECQVRAVYETSEIHVVRMDTADTIDKRRMTGEERQRHLFPPVTDDAHERGIVARRWWDEDHARPRPINPFGLDVKRPAVLRNALRFNAGYEGNPDPGKPFESPYQAGRMSKADETNPHSEGTEAHQRWAAGHGGSPNDLCCEWTRGREAYFNAAQAVVQARDDEIAELYGKLATPPIPEGLEAEGALVVEEFVRGYRNEPLKTE